MLSGSKKAAKAAGLPHSTSERAISQRATRLSSMEVGVPWPRKKSQESKVEKMDTLHWHWLKNTSVWVYGRYIIWYIYRLLWFISQLHWEGVTICILPRKTSGPQERTRQSWESHGCRHPRCWSRHLRFDSSTKNLGLYTGAQKDTNVFPGRFFFADIYIDYRWCFSPHSQILTTFLSIFTALKETKPRSNRKPWFSPSTLGGVL